MALRQSDNPQRDSSFFNWMAPLGMEIPGGMPSGLGGTLEKLLQAAWSKVPAGSQILPAFQAGSRGVASFGENVTPWMGMLVNLLSKIGVP